jgi:hypothetical protein
MKSGCSFAELSDMCLVLGECNGNATDAVRENYRNQRVPYRGTFLALYPRLREKGTFQGMRQDAGLSLALRNVRIEGKILRVADREPAVKTRYLAARKDTS